MINLFSDDDVRTLRNLLDWAKSSRFNPQNRPDVPSSEYRTSEVYVAFVPAGGIPGRTEPTDETGTGDVESSGTGSGVDNPGNAECNVFQLNTANGELEDIGWSQMVWNLSESAIPGNTFVLIVKDKFGTWWAAGTMVDGSTPVCGSVTFPSYRYRCETPPGSGTGTGTEISVSNLNEYRTLLTVTYDANGCLTGTEGDETFTGTIACCDEACVRVPPNVCCTGTMPNVLHVTFMITNALLSLCPPLALLNGTSVAMNFNMTANRWEAMFTTNTETGTGTSGTTNFWVMFYCIIGETHNYWALALDTDYCNFYFITPPPVPITFASFPALQLASGDACTPVSIDMGCFGFNGSAGNSCWDCSATPACFGAVVTE